MKIHAASIGFASKTNVKHTARAHDHRDPKAITPKTTKAAERLRHYLIDGRTKELNKANHKNGVHMTNREIRELAHEFARAELNPSGRQSETFRISA
jgi:hypothetical protein